MHWRFYCNNKEGNRTYAKTVGPLGQNIKPPGSSSTGCGNAERIYPAHHGCVERSERKQNKCCCEQPVYISPGSFPPALLHACHMQKAL